MNIIIVTGRDIDSEFIEAIAHEPDVNIYFSSTTEDALRIIRSVGPETLVLGRAASKEQKSISPASINLESDIQMPPWFLDAHDIETQHKNQGE